jgi:hypothetical protein
LSLLKVFLKLPEKDDGLTSYLLACGSPKYRYKPAVAKCGKKVVRIIYRAWS